MTVTEIGAIDRPIDILPETTAAFVGRALRGPLNEPVLIRNFGEFRRRFGDSWSRSSLGPAARQFFDHGGRKLYIVRVANDARGAMICLPANGSALVLRALDPGSTECFRAAIDYDRIDPGDEERFNLTLQRIDPATGLVVDQELFPGASYREEQENFVAEMLASSTIARVGAPFPRHRPDPTAGSDLPHDACYVIAAEEGSDGRELSDYDVVGSRREETGIFALQQVEKLDLLYIPPPGKDRDLGPASLLAAELYCRERGALLIVDPAADRVTPARAVAGMRATGMASPNVLTYFPRMYLRDDAAGRPRVVGAAIAGLLCKLDRTSGCWHDFDRDGMALDRGLVPAIEVADADVAALVREGVNVITPGSAGRARIRGSVTMGRGRESYGRFVSLPVRRLCLQVTQSIKRGTRWAVFEAVDAGLAERVCGQITDYLAALANLGAFEDDRFVVDCDAGVSCRSDVASHGVTSVVAFRPIGSAHALSFTLHQTASGCRVTSTAFAPAMAVRA